nr:hypothetical protein CFP56_63371 [Quercus suber]POE94785.1 hypothetical protein CFP56_17022 [Quercus suber]
MLDPLLMNAFNTVNLAAACIVTSTEYARELGIPESKWVYPLGGAGTKDSSDSPDDFTDASRSSRNWRVTILTCPSQDLPSQSHYSAASHHSAERATTIRCMSVPTLLFTKLLHTMLT